ASLLSSQSYVAPRNLTEQTLVNIWKELLGIDKVGVYDNFFELGGHSLMVMVLVSSINKRLYTNINIDAIFQYPSISILSEHLNSTNPIEQNILVSLNKNGRQKPIYLTPSASGAIDYYHQLNQSLGKNQPLYCFRCPGLYSKLSVSESIEEMASTFIVEMQKIDSNGPYRLGGYSFGGIIAYEMALQLEREGFKIEELILFDCYPIPVNYKIDEMINLNSEFVTLLEQGMSDLFKEKTKIKDSILHGKSKEHIIEIICDLMKVNELNIKESEIRGRLEVLYNNLKLKNQYQMKEKINTKIVLFKALYSNDPDGDLKDNLLKTFDNEKVRFDYGWMDYTQKEVSVCEIYSNHVSILNSPHTGVISEYLKNN
ncbi:thioesterase domain-containing protein, partial [Ascidiimonas sp. W6]|uniref:thioesterase domain-containing protein n=1 Tax=Ascidiimonas meishanensis TaxID=3128903 RepID=UPI0030EE6AE1